MAGAINPSSCKKDLTRFRLRLPRCPHPIRRIFITISLSPQYRYVRNVWRKVNGYHFGVMWCAWTSAVVLLINLTATLWSINKFGIKDGLGTLQVGDCGSTSRIGFWLHLIINGLSTLLLGASNYSMQCLASPTRSEIDKAHRKCIWLDIGTPSVRNLRWISWSRVGLWWMLAMSSIPLHLFWNSAVLSTLVSREYNIWVAPADFPIGAPFNPPVYFFGDSTYQQLAINASALQRLEPRACLKAYAGSINSNRGDVVLVSSYNTTEGRDMQDIRMLGPVTLEGLGQSICRRQNKSVFGTCDERTAATNVTSWLLKEWKVQYVRTSPENSNPDKNMLMPNTASV